MFYLCNKLNLGMHFQKYVVALCKGKKYFVKIFKYKFEFLVFQAYTLLILWIPNMSSVN